MISEQPKILITSGEPAGIGPDLVIKLAQIEHEFNITVIADPDLLTERAEQLSLPVELVNTSDSQRHNLNQAHLKVLPLKLNKPVNTGKLDPSNTAYVLNMLDTATTECLNGNFDAMVTAPIQKSIINDAGIAFSGHTEYLAQQCGNYLPVMLLACPDLRVALVTTHLPLRDVADAITTEKLESVLATLINEIPSRFGINNPSIAVCGLNPHAGEAGHLGTEEKEIIEPLIRNLNQQGHNVNGPFPADTAFRPEQRQQTDVYVCMYHDQGLPVLKTFGFGEAVNITLGLPIIRTSVDHGTALEIAGTGKANCDSLLAAIETAEQMAVQQKQFYNSTSPQPVSI